MDKFLYFMENSLFKIVFSQDFEHSVQDQDCDDLQAF